MAWVYRCHLVIRDWTLGCSLWFLAQADAVVSIHGRHVGEYHFVADIEALEDYDGVDAAFAKLDVDATGLGAVGIQLKESDGGIRLAVDGAADVEDVPKIFEFNGAIDAEVGARALREWVGNLNINSNSTILNRRIDA